LIEKVAFLSAAFYDTSVHIKDDLTEQEIAYLLERFRQMATLLTGDPAAKAECSYCREELELGEALLTANLSGVLAHLRCPEDALERVLGPAGPDPDFDMAGFLQTLDERMARPGMQECSGEIDVAWPTETSEDESSEAASPGAEGAEGDAQSSLAESNVQSGDLAAESNGRIGEGAITESGNQPGAESAESSGPPGDASRSE